MLHRRAEKEFHRYITYKKKNNIGNKVYHGKYRQGSNLVIDRSQWKFDCSPCNNFVQFEWHFCNLAYTDKFVKYISLYILI